MQYFNQSIEFEFPQNVFPNLSEVAKYLLYAILHGFQHFVFRKNWNQVYDALWKLARDAFEDGRVDENLMETLVILILMIDRLFTIKKF